MIPVVSERHITRTLHTVREQRRITRHSLAARVHASISAVRKRETGERGYSVDVLIDTARALGFDVALIPARRPGARPTGTGWPG